MCCKWTTPSLTMTFHLSCVLLPSSSSCSSSTTSLYSPWQRLYLSAPMWRRLLLKSRLFLWLNSSRHIYRKVPRQGKYSRSDSGGLTDEQRTELNTDLERFEKIVLCHKKQGRSESWGQRSGGRRKPQVKDGKWDLTRSLFQFTVTFLVEGVYYQLVIRKNQAPPSSQDCKDNLELLIITCITLPLCLENLSMRAVKCKETHGFTLRTSKQWFCFNEQRFYLEARLWSGLWEANRRMQGCLIS